MKPLTVRKNDGTIIGPDIKIAKGFFQRLKGLIGSDSLSYGEGLIIVPCNSVHTFFMKYPIDVVFISKEKIVIKIINSMGPYRISAIVPKSYFVMELPSGTCRAYSLQKGEKLSF